MSAPGDPFVVRQEPDRVDRRGLVISGVLMTLAFGIALVAAASLLRADERRDRGGIPPSPTAVSTVETTLILATERGIALRDRQRASLDEYGWIDRDAGRVRIPIDRAMDL